MHQLPGGRWRIPFAIQERRTVPQRCCHIKWVKNRLSNRSWNAAGKRAASLSGSVAPGCIQPHGHARAGEAESSCEMVQGPTAQSWRQPQERGLAGQRGL